RKGRCIASLNFGLQPKYAGGHCRPAFPHFAKLRREIRVVDTHQRLAFTHDLALANQDVANKTSFETLHHLNLARRHDPAVSTLDLVKNREMRPDKRDSNQNDAPD